MYNEITLDENILEKRIDNSREGMMERFYLKNITLSNYRKFEDSPYRLDPRINVFVGHNASGKTTVLEAVCVALGAYLAAYKEYVSSQHVRNIAENDVRLKSNKTEKGIISPSETKQFPCGISCKLQWDDKELPYQRILEKEGGRTKFDGNNPMQKFVTEWEAAIKRADLSDQRYVYPLVLYLSSARLWSEGKAGKELDAIPARTAAYNHCLNSKRGTQLSFGYMKLLRDLASEENEGKSYPVYDTIMDAVRYSLKEELKPGQDIMYSSRYKEIALKNEDSTVIRFSSLSDGYQNVIKIVMEIAARACILNPYLKEEALQKTPGVVVIDELDLSLHPTWQKRIVRILKNLFPKIQFICATHSPFIIQSLEPGELTALDKMVDEEYLGRSIEDIAEGIMDVDMPQYSEKKEEMYQAAKAYFEALGQENISAEELRRLKDRADILASEYSDNPAYGALLQQKYLSRKQT